MITIKKRRAKTPLAEGEPLVSYTPDPATQRVKCLALAVGCSGDEPGFVVVQIDASHLAFLAMSIMRSLSHKRREAGVTNDTRGDDEVIRDFIFDSIANKLNK